MATELLSPEDQEFLEVNGHAWETPTEGGKHGLIIKDYRLPEGYDPGKSDLMLLIPPDYPVGKIEMFYFDPGISRKDGAIIEALLGETHFDRKWQRWSRHYQWRPGIDDVGRHITYVGNQLTSEIQQTR